MVEIERKFLVKNHTFKEHASSENKIIQGYLNSNKERTVRVRIKDKKGYITIKGKSNISGLSRFEWEKEIPLSDAKNLLKLCEPGVIEKTRYEVSIGNHIFEVDEFLGDNNGLYIAEVELRTETEKFTSPAWLGKEVTGDKRYYNSYLSKNPFINW